MELGKRNFTGRPCERASSTARRRSPSVPSTLTSWAVSGTNSARVESRAARWNTSGDLELALEPIQQMAIEDVPDPDRGAVPRQLRLQGPEVEGQDVEGAELGQARDQAMPHLAAGAGHQHHGLARHSDGSATTWLRAASVPVARAASPMRAPRRWDTPTVGCQPAPHVYLPPHLEGLIRAPDRQFALRRVRFVNRGVGRPLALDSAGRNAQCRTRRRARWSSGMS